MLRSSPLLARLLCTALAAVFLVPPPALWAQDPPERPQQGLGGEEVEPTADLSGLTRLEVEPTTGELQYAACDLELGDGEQAFRLVRTWRPWAGDTANLGVHWVTPLDVHLDVDRDGARAGLVTATGERVFFRRGEDGALRAISGRNTAVIERFRGGYQVTGLGDERTWRFDRQGWPLESRRAGATWRWVYDQDQRAVRLETPAGALSLVRDEQGALQRVEAPGGLSVTFTRDAAGNLIRVRRAGSFEELSYDPLGRLRTLGGGLAQISWDAASRVSAIRGAGVQPLTATYTQADDSQRAFTSSITREGQTSTVTVSRDRRRVAWASPLDPTLESVLTYDERAQPVKLVGADGVTCTWTWDARGRLSEERGPNGATRYEYASHVTDRPTRVVMPDGRELRFTYDLKGLLIKAAASGGGEQSWSYDLNGRLVETTDPRGAVTRYGWDERSLLVAVEEVGVGTTRFGRDERGRVVAVKADTGQVIKVEYDAQGRVRSLSDVRGVLLATDYDARGNLIRRLDELGNETRWSYGPRGELREASDALGTLGKWTYGEDGRLASFTDGGGSVTRWERPDARTLIVRDATIGTRQLKFDGLGRLVSEDRAGVQLGYRYDPLGNLVARSTPAGQETFARDAQGRLVGLAGPAGGLELRYDQAGRLAGLKEKTFGKEVAYGYSPAGDRTELRLPWGTVKYTLDARGRVTGLRLPSGEELAITLRADGTRESIRYPNGVETRFSYQRGRVVDIHTTKGTETIDRRRYGWGARGRLAWTEDARGQRTTYQHDARGRLTEAKSPQGAQTWSYDAAGNRLEESRGQETVTGKVEPGNKLVQSGQKKLGYGPTGALTTIEDQRGTTRLSYDHDDHLVEVVNPDGSKVRYGYAPNGTRLWREDARGKTFFLYDLADVVAELDAQGNVIAGYVHGDATDDLLAAVKDGESLYYHYDLVRSVTAVTGQEGRLAARYAYDAFGREQSAEGDLAGWNRWRYTSRELDGATGLYHYRARSYAPELGRFTSPDPAGRMGGFNLYAYVENDPTQFNDPFGLDPQRPWWKRAWDSVSDAASNVVSSTVAMGSRLVDDFSSSEFGKRAIAFGRGFGNGVVSAASGLVNMVLHPIDTFNGIAYAIENWDETKEALLAKWDEFKDAYHNDPEKFYEMLGHVVAEAAVSATPYAAVAVASKVGATARLASAASRLGTATRVAASPVTRVARTATSAVGNGFASRFPTVARTVRTGGRLSVLRDAELARRAASGGNIFARTGRRVVNVGRDIGAGSRLAVRAPGAFVVYGGHRLTGAAAKLVLATARGTWTLRHGVIPTALVFNDQITDAINRTASRESAGQDAAVLARRFLADAPHLPADELARRLAEVSSAYDTYRNRLLAPIHEEDLALDARLRELEAAVARGDIPENAVDARLEAMLSEYARRRLTILTDIYDRSRDVAHDMFNPSPNRLIAYGDEVALLDEALSRVTDPAARALLEARKADLIERAGLEEERFRMGEHDALISGVAGPPRDPGQTPGELEGAESTSLDDLIAPVAPDTAPPEATLEADPWAELDEPGPDAAPETPTTPTQPLPGPTSEGPDWPTEEGGQ